VSENNGEEPRLLSLHECQFGQHHIDARFVLLCEFQTQVDQNPSTV
jgi:hypothetical protein